MRLAACIVVSSLAGCAGSPTDDSGPVARCETTECFYERDIRNYEVVDRSTLIVYVGAQRCPFVIELDGLACDVKIAPDIHFIQSTLGRLDRGTNITNLQVCTTTRGLYAYTGILDPSMLRADDAFDRTRRRGAGVFERPGSRPGTIEGNVPIDPASEDICRVRQIRSVNDDQVLELYADAGVLPPPPPIGEGQLEVPESETTDDAAATSEDGSAEEGASEDPGAEEEGGQIDAPSRQGETAQAR